MKDHIRSLKISLEEFCWDGVGCLAFGVNLRVCQLTHSLVFVQKYTLITSLSEFISVFMQPTSSVVFRVLYEHLMILYTKQYGSSNENGCFGFFMSYIHLIKLVIIIMINNTSP